MTRIYLCGSEVLSTENKDFAEIDRIKSVLKTMKCSIVDPREMAFSQMNWSDTLQSRIDLLKQSNIIYVLPNWKKSIMARIELTVAMDMRLSTIFHPTTKKEIKQILTTLDD